MILAISCHYLIACDVYHVFASYLLRTTVVSKMISYNNFKRRVPPNCAPLRRFVVSKHHVMTGVIDSNVRIQRVLTSLACTDMASEHMRNT